QENFLVRIERVHHQVQQLLDLGLEFAFFRLHGLGHGGSPCSLLHESGWPVTGGPQPGHMVAFGGHSRCIACTELSSCEKVAPPQETGAVILYTSQGREE